MTDDVMQRAMEKSRLDGTYEEGPFTAGWLSALAHVDEMAAKLRRTSIQLVPEGDYVRVYEIGAGSSNLTNAPTLTEALEAATREVRDA